MANTPKEKRPTIVYPDDDDNHQQLSLSEPNHERGIKVKQTILIAISNSKNSIYALNWTKAHLISQNLVEDQRVCVILFSVLLPAAELPGYYGGIAPEYYMHNATFNEEQERNAFKFLSNLLRNCRKSLVRTFPNIDVKMVVANG